MENLSKESERTFTRQEVRKIVIEFENFYMEFEDAVFKNYEPGKDDPKKFSDEAFDKTFDAALKAVDENSNWD